MYIIISCVQEREGGGGQGEREREREREVHADHNTLVCTYLVC